MAQLESQMGFQILLSSSSKCKRNSVGESTDTVLLLTHRVPLIHSFVQHLLMEPYYVAGMRLVLVMKRWMQLTCLCLFKFTTVCVFVEVGNRHRNVSYNCDEVKEGHIDDA